MIKLIWRSLWAKPLQSVIGLLVISASVAMMIVVMQLSTSVQRGIVMASEPFNLLVGAKGSPNQLVLNTIFLQDVPIGNVDKDVLKKLKNDDRVERAIPLGFGDNYKGFRVVGTEPQLFDYPIKMNQSDIWLKLDEGRVFEKPFEAVIGAQTARLTGLKLGDTFSSSHGLMDYGKNKSHAEKFVVVGIMSDVKGPYNTGIFVSMESIWSVHKHHAKPGQVVKNDEHEDGVTAIIVRPKGYAEAMKLYQSYQKDSDAQLIFPAQIVIKLFSVLGEGEKVLRIIGGIIFVMALFIIACSLYWSSMNRSRERTIMRAIGASRRDLQKMIFGEGVILVGMSVVIGTIGGHSMFWLIANELQKRTALAMVAEVSWLEGASLLVILVTGVAASMVPIIHTLRKEMADDL